MNSEDYYIELASIYKTALIAELLHEPADIPLIVGMYNNIEQKQRLADADNKEWYKVYDEMKKK